MTITKYCIRLISRRKNFSFAVKNFSAFSGSIKPTNTSYLSTPAEFPLINKTVGELVDGAAELYGSKEAVYFIEENKRLSFEEIKDESDRFAAGLLKVGLKPGDRLGIWGPNSWQWYIAQMAAAKAGLISVFINPAYQTRELLYSLNNVSIKGIVISGQFKTQNYCKMLHELVPEMSDSFLGNIRSPNVPNLSTVISMDEASPEKSVFTYNQIVSDGSSGESQVVLEKIKAAVQVDNVCNIQFTSGTTGQPKGVMLSHHTIINNTFITGRRFNVNSKDKFCLPVPLFHCFGSIFGVLTALNYGSSCVFPSRAFNASLAVQAAANERCTIMCGTPTMHIDMINVSNIGRLNLKSLRSAVTGGSLCPIELVKEMKSKYTVDTVDMIYGQTEMGPLTCLSLPDDTEEIRSTTVGYPIEHTETKVVDTNGKIVPLETVGELCFRNSMTTHGYWGDPKKTADTIDQARWLHTGDLGLMTKLDISRLLED